MKNCHVTFENCNIKEASFNNIKWKNLIFLKSDLTSSEFYNFCTTKYTINRGKLGKGRKYVQIIEYLHLIKD